MAARCGLEGEVFGRLTALQYRGRSIWSCRCECGADTLVNARNLNSGNTKSCGCAHREVLGSINRTHGMTRTPTYVAWCSMKARCSNPRNIGYANYGGRGITVCPRWVNSFENFLADMGVRPGGMTLDRFPLLDGNYEPANCRWASPVEQAGNKRSNVYLSHDGKTQTVAQWARELGVSPSLISGRKALGWSDERALTTRRGRRLLTNDQIDTAIAELPRTYRKVGLKALARRLGVSADTLRNSIARRTLETATS